ncbi:MAG: hypothetical protein ABIP45_02835 [Knoellia sp.]
MRTPLVIERAADHMCTSGTHSRVADGRVVCWSPPRAHNAAYAVDAEIAAQSPPPHLEVRWCGLWDAHDGFWGAWCASEVCAKLWDIPIVVLAARSPVGASPVTRAGQTVTYAVRAEGDLVVALGILTA